MTPANSNVEIAKRGPGRPSKFTQKMLIEICERISDGEPLAHICRSVGMPNPSTVRRWIERDEEVSRAIAHAREDGFDFLAAECLRIADTPMEGVEVTTKPDGVKEEKRGDMLGHRKLQIETRLKLLAKWDPKRYGERIEQNHTGGMTLEALVSAANKRG